MKCYRDDSYRIRIISFMLIFIGMVKGYTECPIGEYQCFNGDCIRGDYFCDFVPDCSDNSDETFCYLECTYAEDLRGAKYRGKRNITKSGRPCQRYDQQSPHAHNFGYLGTTSENYCRNDDNSPGPWCYTLDPDVRWEVCATPRCTEYKLGNCNFETDMCDWKKSRDSIPWNRQDNWMDDTEGKKILLMDLTMDSPTNYSLFLSPVVIPTYDLTCFGVSYYTYGSGVQDIYIYVAYGMNELKLVSSSRDIRENVWHHTMVSISEQIQYGIVMRAEISDFDTGGIAIGDLSLELGICPGLDLCSTSQYQCDDWTCIDVHKFCDGVIDCPDSSDELNCQFHCLPEYDLRGLLYRGEINATKSGRVCQRWDTQEPQGHDFYWEKENYCRNPDNDEEPWCYTVDPDIRFEFCSVPRCDYDCLQKDDNAGTYYRGHLNVSSSGRQCQRWDQQTPHSHSYTKFSTEENYCRNDGVDLTIWCYTIDRDVRWEYCHLPICEPSKCRQDDPSCVNSQKQEQSTESGETDLVTGDGSCLSGFLCRDSDVCLEKSQVCDGIYQCQHHDDEAMCNISCPDGCFCNGSILNCSITYAGVSSFPKNIRVLRLSGDQFTLDMLFEAVLPFLIHLNISYTHFVSIGHEDIFEIKLHCSNLQSLYLGHNKIATISRYAFARLTQLRELHLNGNPILTLQPNTFNQLQSVNYLSIIESPLKSVLNGIFNGLINIKTLNFDSNKLDTIESQSLQSLREITNIYLSNNNLTALSQYFSSKMTQLVVLDLRHNHIQNITSRSLEGLYYLEQLDLSSNGIQIMPQNAFIFLQALLKLNLSHNMISGIESGAFEGLVSLQSLDLEGNKLEYISAGSLRGLKSVTFINLNSNSLHQIEPQTFTDVGELSVLYLQNNRLTVYKEMFYGLCKLKTIHADTYRVCCAKPPSVLAENCVAPVDTISSCDHLIDVGILSISIWFIAVFTLGGNVFVVIYRFSMIRKRKSSPHIIFILNLSISDFVMGIYLMIIAVADLQFRGDYGYNDLQWRHSTTCTVSGIMATVSSETSAILLFVITIDRLFALKFPFSKFRFTFKSSIYLSITVWLLAGVLAILPVIFFDSYYALSSVCISLPLSTIQEVGREYSMGLFIFFNLTLFLGIVAGQLLIYLEVRHVEKHTNKDKSNEAAVARTLITLALTDALCWIPIAILGILTQIGIEVSSTVYAWVIVLVLPINSAINPFLYTFSAIRSKRIRKHTKSEIYSKSSLTYVSTKRRNIYSIAEVRVVPDHRPQTLCLADCPKHHSLSLAEIYTIVERIVQDLQMFHLKNLIHSSISEENIFICLDTSSATGKKRDTIRDVWLSSKDNNTVNADRHRDMYALGQLISCLLAEHSSL